MSHDPAPACPRHQHGEHPHGEPPDRPRKPRKQEQEPAQRTVTELAPGVLRMQLPITMPGLGHVNMYALVDAQGVALVDPGLPTPGTWSAIRDRLRQAGLQPRHVHTVIVTHSHPDHFGGAARLARASGAAVVAHRSFRFGVVQATQDPEVSVDDLAASESGSGARATTCSAASSRSAAAPRPGAASIRARRSRCACAGASRAGWAAPSSRSSRSRCAPATCCGSAAASG
jgi:hypothetical protein